MPLQQLKTVNFGKSRSGISGSVGYALFNTDGSVNSARTNTGVYELTASSGMYAAFVSFPDDFRGSIVWDSGETPVSRLVFATEQYNYEENNPNVDLILSQSTDVSGSLQAISSSLGTLIADVQFIKDIEGGRWIIDESVNQMIFYKSDNTTEVARFDLKDINGDPTSTEVFERVRT